MISSRKRQLVIALILACTCVPILGREPNQPKAGLKFEINREKQQWIVEPMHEIGKGPIKPTYVAVLLIESERIPIIHWNDISNSRVGQTMSQEQHDFLNQGEVRYIRHKEAYREFHWYAVSEDDARKTVRAFLEVWNDKVNTKLQPLLSQRQELQEKIAETKKKIPEKATEIKTVKSEIAKRKKENITVSYLSIDEANKTISELNRMFSTLTIEHAGMRSRLQTIDIYKVKLGKEISADHRFKLEEMQIQQVIELRAAEAKQQTTLELLSRIQAFCDAHQRLAQLQVTKRSLSRDLLTYEKEQREIKETLANPTPDMLPPKVYQNKVTIYPVRAGE